MCRSVPPVMRGGRSPSAPPRREGQLDGTGQLRPTAFTIAFKEHVVVDGALSPDLRASDYQTAAATPARLVVGGANNTLSRCFYDGRAATYMPYFVSGAAHRTCCWRTA